MPSKKGASTATGTTRSRKKKKAPAVKKAKPKKTAAATKTKAKAKTKTKAKAKAKSRKKAPASRKSSARKKASSACNGPPDWSSLLATVRVPVDTRAYPLEAIYGAAYVFLDRAYVHVRSVDAHRADVLLASKSEVNDDELASLGGEFANELVNQMLRSTLDESGRKIREYIVAKAHFFQDRGGQDVQRLLDATMQEAFDEDPLDIAVPWEEKYGDGSAEKT